MNNKGKITIIVIAMVLVNVNAAFSTIRRVNNNTGVTGSGVFATLTAAVTASSANDTIIIEGSNTAYGDITIAKKLTIFGPGYYLTQNTQTQATLIPATLGIVTYNAGSEGSLISGCQITSITVNADNITIARNYIRNPDPASPSILLNNNTINTIIQQNIVAGVISNTPNKTPSVVIRNNLLGRIVLTASITAAYITNNTFYHLYSSSGYQAYAIDVNKSNIFNNIIFYGSYNPGGYWTPCGQLKFDESQMNTISYNILNQAAPAVNAGTANQFGVDMNSIFAVVNSEIDKNWQIIGGSAAETGGQGGIECGMFGGDFEYVLSGMPPIPHIYLLDANPAGNDQQPLQVKISVKSQN